MKIFIDINNKKIESENKSEKNYYLLKFKDIEIKDEFQEFNYKIVNNIEVKLNIKVKNKFNSEKVENLFQKFQPNQNQKRGYYRPNSIIGTGVNMKERLAMFSNTKKENNEKNNNFIPKKLKMPETFLSDSKEKKNNENININEEKNVNKEKGIQNTIDKGKGKKEKDKINKEEEKEENKIEIIKDDNKNIKDLSKNKEIKEENKDIKKENEDNNKENENIKKENEEIKKENEEIKKENEDNKKENEEIKKENEDNKKENEEIKKENEEEILEEKKEGEIKKEIENKNKEEKTDFINLGEIKNEEFSSDKEEVEEDDDSNININKEINKIKSKEEEIEIKNPISQEKTIEKSFQKRPSHILNFINPLNEDLEESEPKTRPRGFAKFFMPKKKEEDKQDIQKSEKIIENTQDRNSLEKKVDENEKEKDFLKKTMTLNVDNLAMNSKKKIEENFGLTPTSSIHSAENDLDDDISYRTVSTEYSSSKSLIPEIILDSIKYEKYLELLNQKQMKECYTKRESFCEGFFLASFPYKNGQVIENSNDIFPALCNHPDCSKLNAMKPEILIRYPLEDTDNLELNNLAATICFPTGIKVCYSQENPPPGIKDYMTNITNQKGERYYMMTYHFYVKMMNDEYSKKYEMHPLKHSLMKFGDAYLTFREEEFTEEITEKVQQILGFCQDLGFREYVYVPFCLCLISKYPYSFEMEKCLQSIFKIISEDKKDYNFEINDLIMYVINSVPIPDKNSLVKFYIPYCNRDISLRCTTINGLNIMNIDFAKLTQIFSINNIIIIFRLLLSEKKILFIDDDYTVLSKVTDAFISLLYPLKWVHTYIPIMSEQMLKYLESFLPFLNGIHTSLMPLVINIFKEGEIDEIEEVFLVYIKENDIQIGSSLKGKKIKISKYIQNNVLSLPTNAEKELRKKLTYVQDKFQAFQKNPKKKNSNDINQLDFKFRDAFIDVFVLFFHDYQKYIGLLDDDEVIFNKNLFLQQIKKDEKKFYENFLDSQLFEQFSQNILTNDCNYFNKKVELFKKKGKKEENILISSKNFILDKNYKIVPDFLKLEDTENNTAIERALKEKFQIEFKTDKNGIILPSERIINNINNISNDKYDKSKCLIYLLPEKKETNQNNNNKQELELEQEDFHSQFLKKIKAQRIFPFMVGAPRRKKTFLNSSVRESDLTDKRKELIKDEIKEWVIKIFKSEIDDYKNNPKVKTDVLSLINNPFGIKCFVDLISHNNQSVIMLQKYSFLLLGFIIYNGLLFLLRCEETEEVLEECVLLFKSLKYFSIKIGGKNKTYMDGINFKSNVKKYVKINQKNFWIKWFNLELKEKQSMKKNEGNDEIGEEEEEKDLLKVKQEILLKICLNMIELEIAKTTIKSICDEINDKIFGKTTDLGKQTSETYINYITLAKYNIKSI